MPQDWPLVRYRRAVGYRLIPSKYPPIRLFEDVADPDEFAAIHKVQALTNPRLRQSVGDLSLVELGEMQLGVPGAGYIMAAFTHVNPRGSRFSDGSYGVYYCARATATAIAETVHHLRLFFAATREPAQGLAMRCLRGVFSAALRDVSGHRAALHPDDYRESQRIGRALRQAGEDGLVYPSVRHPGGLCYALLRPRCLSRVVQTAHYRYAWNGTDFEVYRLSRK
jgi:hypothetical protein